MTPQVNQDFGNLPVEVIENIFIYLTIDDVIEASLVCHKWFKASLSPEIVARTKLVIDRKFTDEDFLYRILTNGSNMRKFKSVIFKSVVFNEETSKDRNVWIQLGKTTTDLTFKWCTITESKLFSILDNFPILSQLNIHFDVNKELDINPILIKYVDKLESLYLTGSCPVNEQAISAMSDKRPTIQKLTLDTVNYPDDYSMLPTVQFLEKLSVCLKSLSVYFYREGIDLLEVISKMENLRLESLLCHMYDGIDKDLFKKFVLRLSTLVDLDISPIRLKDSSFTEICTFMPNLLSLRINECDAISNKGIVEVTKLTKLQKLIITQCHNVSNAGIINGIAKSRNETMKYILLAGYYSDDSLIGIAQNLPNLRNLQICTSLFLSERCVRTIFEHLKLLRVLRLDSLNSESNKNCFEPHEVIQTLIPSTSEQFTISSIKGLRELTLNGFGIIPGASIEEIATLVELKSLQISSFSNMSKIENLVKQCGSLKTIDLSYCESISSGTIYFLATKLKRLKSLQIKQKDKIEDECLESIKATVKDLNLNVVEY